MFNKLIKGIELIKIIKYRLKIIKAIYPSNPYLKLFIKFYYKFLSAVR